MAGQELFIQPIIHNSLGTMSENIESMNTQLSETTRILMNILNNQGLAQNQKVYTGSTFSELTLSGDTSATQNLTGYGGQTFTVDANGVIEADWGSTTFSKGLNFGALDLRNQTKIGINLKTIQFSSSGQTATIKLRFVFEDDTTTDADLLSLSQYSPPAYDTTHFYTLTSGQKKKVKSLILWIYCNGNKTVRPKINGLYIGDSKYILEEYPAIGFNSANVLTYVGTVSTGFTFKYTKSKTVYITIPDISEVASWVSILTKGTIDKLSIALVDGTTHDILKLIETETADLSELQQFTNLALMVTYPGDSDIAKYLTGFTMRYF